jgi:hypothetical protein
MLLKTINRTVVRTTLESLRLPLSTVERIAGQTDNEAWPPALLFQDFQSNALQLVGGFLRDDELVSQGRLQAAKVSELRRAAELELRAEQTRQEADTKLEQQRKAAAQDRQRTTQRAQSREQAVEQEVRQAEAQLTQEARQAQADIDAAAEKREREVAAKERNARLAALDREEKALAKQQAALASTDRAAALGEKLETKKQQRKS